MLLSDHKASQLSKQLSQQTEDSSNGSGNGTLGSRFTPRLRAFTDIAGYSGVSQKLREKQFYICINFLSPKKQKKKNFCSGICVWQPSPLVDNDPARHSDLSPYVHRWTSDVICSFQQRQLSSWIPLLQR